MQEAGVRHGTGMVLVFMAGVCWSTVGLGVRLIEEASVWQILLYRSVALALFLAIVIRLRTGRGPLGPARRLGPAGVIGGLALVAAYTGGVYSLQATNVATALLLFASAPFMAALLGRVVLGERVRRATWVAVLVAMAGIGVMVRDDFGAGSLAGNLAALGSAFGFATFTVALRWGRAGDMMPAVFLSGIFGAVIMFAICMAVDAPLILLPRDAGISASMGVLQVGLGLVLYTIGSKVVPAVELTLLSLAEVILGPVWVWLLLGETISSTTLLGGAILLSAIIGNALSGARRKRPPHMA